jgi:hypothetical protein
VALHPPFLHSLTPFVIISVPSTTDGIRVSTGIVQTQFLPKHDVAYREERKEGFLDGSFVDIDGVKLDVGGTGVVEEASELVDTGREGMC